MKDKVDKLLERIEEKKLEPKREAEKKRKEQGEKELFKEYDELFSWDINSKTLTCLEISNHKKVIEAISFCRKSIKKFTTNVKEKELEKVKIIIGFDLKINEKYIFINEVNLSHCIFQKNVAIINCTFEGQVLITNSTFKKSINLEETTFEKSVKFHQSVFEQGIKLMNTEFCKLADFYSVTFKSTQSFYKTDFLNVTIFSNAIFEKPAQWLYNKVSSKTIISFENAVFLDGIDISRANFFCKVSFWGVSVEPLIPNDLTIFEDCESKDKNIRRQTAFKRIRESYRRIKQVFISENNIIDSLPFKSKEMEIYSKGMIIKWKLFDCLTNLRNSKDLALNFLLPSYYYKYVKRQEFSFGEFYILLLAKFSNHFGRSWFRALTFILFINLLLYWALLEVNFNNLEWCDNWDCKKKWLNGYFKVINVTNWKLEFLNNENLSGWTYIITFIGRVFIGYGIYQMITAFRKFGKN